MLPEHHSVDRAHRLKDFDIRLSDFRISWVPISLDELPALGLVRLLPRLCWARLVEAIPLDSHAAEKKALSDAVL